MTAWHIQRAVCWINRSILWWKLCADYLRSKVLGAWPWSEISVACCTPQWICHFWKSFITTVWSFIPHPTRWSNKCHRIQWLDSNPIPLITSQCCIHLRWIFFIYGTAVLLRWECRMKWSVWKHKILREMLIFYREHLKLLGDARGPRGMFWPTFPT